MTNHSKNCYVHVLDLKTFPLDLCRRLKSFLTLFDVFLEAIDQFLFDVSDLESKYQENKLPLKYNSSYHNSKITCDRYA
jgi:hypothetical protein